MKIYLISPPKLTKSFNSKIFDTITDIIPIEYFQFRPKFKLLKDRLNFVEIHYESFSRICKKKKIKLIINDDFEIAEEFTFDGIHLGQNDKSCKAAKEKFGKEFIVGVSCSSSENLYKKAKSDGANMLNINDLPILFIVFSLIDVFGELIKSFLFEFLKKFHSSSFF